MRKQGRFIINGVSIKKALHNRGDLTTCPVCGHPLAPQGACSNPDCDM